MVIKSPKRDEIMTKLRSIGVASGVHYQPNHEFPVFAPYYSGNCPNVEKVSKQLLSLPNHLYLQQSDVNKICDAVKEVCC